MSTQRRSRHGVLVFKDVTDLTTIPTDMGLDCYGCQCNCCIASRKNAPFGMCCLRETEDPARMQQDGKPKSVFDYFYEQLYSDKKTNNVCQQYKTNACSCKTDTKPPLSLGNNRVSKDNLPQEPVREFRSERFKPYQFSQFSSKTPVSRKTCDSSFKLERPPDTHGSKLGGGEHRENVVPAIGVSLGCFEIYIAHESHRPEEVNQERYVRLKEAFGLAASVDGCVVNHAKDVPEGKTAASIQRKLNSNNSRRIRRRRQRCSRKRSKERRRGKFSSSTSNDSHEERSTGRKRSDKISSPTSDDGHDKRSKFNDKFSSSTSNEGHEGRFTPDVSLSKPSFALSGYSGNSRAKHVGDGSSTSKFKVAVIDRKRLPHSRSRSESESRSRSSSHHSYKSSSVQSITSKSRDCSRSRSGSCSLSSSSHRGPAKKTRRKYRSRERHGRFTSDHRGRGGRPVRSPSIRRRPGSPCYLDKRRITSARKRPVPYTRPDPSSASSSSSSDSESSSSTSSSRSHSSRSRFSSQ